MPVEDVYSAVVQVASADYNLKSAIKDGYTVNFFAGGEYPLVLSAICREGGSGQTEVSLSITQGEGNPQIFRVGKTEDKEAARFWAELDKAIKLNETLKSSMAAPQNAVASTGIDTVAIVIMSAPEGAEVEVDGKVAGNTPSSISVKSGQHAVRVSHDGFKVWTCILITSAGGQISLDAHLDRDGTDLQ
jgi:hypothetical protein